MAPNDKAAEHAAEALPSYEEAGAGPSSSRELDSEAHVSDGLTVTSPFNFPSTDTTALPPYSTPSIIKRPVAIPQVNPDPTAPFLDAYAESLLGFGIPAETWRQFLKASSAFLGAKVSDKALAHAADVGREVTSVPRRFGKDTARHAKSVANNITRSAKRGDVFGSAVGVFSGAISLPVATAVRAAGAVVSLPFAAVSAVASKPKTPRARVEAYAAVANKDWLHSRGLEVKLVETWELAEWVGVPASRLLDAAKAAKSGSATDQLNALAEYFAPLEVYDSPSLELGAKSYWLLVTRISE